MEGINQSENTEKKVLSRKSWTAYVAPFFILLIVFLVLGSFHLALGIVPALLAVYSILIIRSHELYMNNDGVWLYRGIFPWNKGSHGVKWRDLDEAVYVTGFTSWALKSYTMKISHRFTKDSEIILTHMKVGDTAVQEINNQHKIQVSTSNA